MKIKNTDSDFEIWGSSRRTFIKNIGYVAVGTFAVSVIGCGGGSDPMGPDDGGGNGNNVLTVDLSKPENQSLKTIGGTLALESNIIDNKGLLIYRESVNSVKVFSRECTHQQCQVGPFINGISSCPCHGSKYDLTGKNIAGPAPRPLPQYMAALNINLVTINT